MAFKIPITATCDHCAEEITVYAVSRDDANRSYRVKGWYAEGDSHLCKKCHKEQQK